MVADVSRESSVALARLFSDGCCTDILRYLHPTTQGFTWSRADGLVSSRIDVVGRPYVWVASVSSCDILPCPFSDHCALALSIDPPNATPPGPGLWKINSALLQDSDYVSTITDFWLDWRTRKGDFPSLAKWWDVGKSKIKGLTISYCVRGSQKQNQTRSLLSRLAGHLKELLDAGMVSCLGPYQAVLGRLAQLDTEAARGAQIRSRIKWVEEERCLPLFSVALRKRGPLIVGSPLYAGLTVVLFLIHLAFPLLFRTFIPHYSPLPRRMPLLGRPSLPIYRHLSPLICRDNAMVFLLLMNATTPC